MTRRVHGDDDLLDRFLVECARVFGYIEVRGRQPLVDPDAHCTVCGDGLLGRQARPRLVPGGLVVVCDHCRQQVRIVQSMGGPAIRWKENVMSEFDQVVAAVRRVAASHAEFTSDDVRAALDAQPAEPKTVGTAFMELHRRGEIESTERFVISTRPEAHGRRVQVWKHTEATT